MPWETFLIPRFRACDLNHSCEVTFSVLKSSFDDFSSLMYLPQSVVELIIQHFGQITNSSAIPIAPEHKIPFHDDTRFLCLAEPEASGVSFLNLLFHKCLECVLINIRWLPVASFIISNGDFLVFKLDCTV